MSSLFAVLFVAWTGYAACSDWRDRRVTNTWITLGLGSAVALAVIGTPAREFFPSADRLDCALGLMFGLLVLLPAFALRAVGASDVKFLQCLGHGPAFTRFFGPGLSRAYWPCCTRWCMPWQFHVPTTAAP